MLTWHSQARTARGRGAPDLEQALEYLMEINNLNHSSASPGAGAGWFPILPNLTAERYAH
jgi:hypothetical protein